jgi:hypothetical protein
LLSLNKIQNPIRNISEKEEFVKMRISQVVTAVAAIVAMVVIQIPTAQGAGSCGYMYGTKVCCDVADSSVSTNWWGEWMSFTAVLTVEGGSSATYGCTRAGLSTTYTCTPTPSSPRILVSGWDIHGNLLSRRVYQTDITINPGDGCAGCTACKALLLKY